MDNWDFITYFIGGVVGFIFGILVCYAEMSELPKYLIVEKVRKDNIMLNSKHWIEYDKKYNIGDTIKIY